ncbi:unnamed protein product, partial [Vitrella brassicaformis CCMP3155]
MSSGSQASAAASHSATPAGRGDTNDVTLDELRGAVDNLIRLFRPSGTSTVTSAIIKSERIHNLSNLLDRVLPEDIDDESQRPEVVRRLLTEASARLKTLAYCLAESLEDESGWTPDGINIAASRLLLTLSQCGCAFRIGREKASRLFVTMERVLTSSSHPTVLNRAFIYLASLFMPHFMASAAWAERLDTYREILISEHGSVIDQAEAVVRMMGDADGAGRAAAAFLRSLCSRASPPSYWMRLFGVLVDIVLNEATPVFDGRPLMGCIMETLVMNFPLANEDGERVVCEHSRAHVRQLHEYEQPFQMHVASKIDPLLSALTSSTIGAVVDLVQWKALCLLGSIVHILEYVDEESDDISAWGVQCRRALKRIATTMSADSNTLDAIARLIATRPEAARFDWDVMMGLSLPANITYGFELGGRESDKRYLRLVKANFVPAITSVLCDRRLMTSDKWGHEVAFIAFHLIEEFSGLDLKV